jgi:ubiquinone/menaquinone biosynthesis C-methylase UbiE
MNKKNSKNVDLSSLSLTNDIEKWYKGMGQQFFQYLGVEKGHRILDFGSRVGNYTIPAAMIVGKTGKIVALDKDHNAINQLIDRAQHLSLTSIIQPIKTKGELKIPLEDHSIDFILFYDVFRSLWNGTFNPYITLLKEFNRILKPAGKLSILLEHIRDLSCTVDEIINETGSYFILKSKREIKALHWNHLERSTFHLFVKKKE